VPVLTVQLADLQAEGPRLDVRLIDGAGSAPPIVVAALIDTGATVTVVANQIVKQLRLSPMGKFRGQKEILDGRGRGARKLTISD